MRLSVRRLMSSVVLLVGVSLLGACSAGGTGETGVEAPNSDRISIGPDGGEFELVPGVVLVVPSGAFRTETFITAEEADAPDGLREHVAEGIFVHLESTEQPEKPLGVVFDVDEQDVGEDSIVGYHEFDGEVGFADLDADGEPDTATMELEVLADLGWLRLDVEELGDDLEQHLVTYLGDEITDLEPPHCEGAEAALGGGWAVDSDLGHGAPWCIGLSDGHRSLTFTNPHHRPVLVSTPDGASPAGRSDHDLGDVFPDTVTPEGWSMLFAGQGADWNLELAPGGAARFRIASGGSAEMVAALDAATDWLGRFAADLPGRPGPNRIALVELIGDSDCLEPFLPNADPERAVEPGELTHLLRSCLDDEPLEAWAGDGFVPVLRRAAEVLLDGDAFAEAWRAGEPVGDGGSEISVSVEDPAPPNTPEAVAQAFLDAVVAGDAARAHALTTGDVDPSAYEWTRRIYEEVGSAELWGPAGCFTLDDTLCSWFRSDPSPNLVMAERGGRWLVSHPVSPLADQLEFMGDPEHHLMCVEDTTPLNLRGGPGTDWPAFAQLAIDRCGLMGYPIVETAPNGGTWRLIGVPGGPVGWVFDDHLRLQSE